MDSLLLKNLCLPDFGQPCNPEAFGKSSWDHIFSSLDGRIGDDILFVPDGLRCDCSPSWAAGADALFTARGERCNFVHPRRSGNKICSSSASGDQILFIPIDDEIWPHPKSHPKWWVMNSVQLHVAYMNRHSYVGSLLPPRMATFCPSRSVEDKAEQG